MPRIRMDAKAWTNEFRALAAQASSLNEHNDCTVKALALVTGVEYNTVHAALAAEGRKPRKGTYNYQQWAALSKMGFKVTQVLRDDFIKQYPAPHNNLRSVTTHHPHRFNKVWADGHSYLVYTSRHVTAVVNGVNHDWTRGRAKRVESIYKVERKEAA